jgi:hypothetical protein
MSSSSDSELVTGHFFVANTQVKPEILGRGPARVDGSSYLQGPNIMGSDQAFPKICATLMIAPLSNSQSPPPNVLGTFCGTQPRFPSLYVIGDSVLKGNYFVTTDILAGNNITAQGEIKSRCGKHILSAKKNFDIPHPSKDGWRLRHTCPEAPTNDVYIRGRVKNQNEIELPKYWKDFVDTESITVNLTPVGSHQNVIIKRIDESKVYLQSNGGMPIDCFYHIFAERKDGEKLISEYEGKSPEDYPGNNDEYSISGYHYDIKEKNNA